MSKVEIGIIGGTGFYKFLDKVEKVRVDTPYGPTSAPLSLGEIGGLKVAFIPRHGEMHEYPPHKIPYLANIWALAQLGVKRIIAPCAVGSLQPHIKPGDFVFCDQFINFTRDRRDTFYDGPITTHISSADPYCPELRDIAIKSAKRLNLSFHEKGTVVVIQGPRFSTRAESKFFKNQGWEVINMTQYPECVLAREKEICYLNISIVTDYDVGLEGDPNIKPVTHREVVKVFSENLEKLKELLFDIIPKIPLERNCICSRALKEARMEAKD